MTAHARKFDAGTKLAAVEREIKFRKRVYPRFIADGKMTDGFAASQIAVMEAIAEDYREEAQKERLI
jgi:uncharacterized protein CbrC (UPF0167 family)